MARLRWRLKQRGNGRGAAVGSPFRSRLPKWRSPDGSPAGFPGAAAPAHFRLAARPRQLSKQVPPRRSEKLVFLMTRLGHRVCVAAVHHQNAVRVPLTGIDYPDRRDRRNSRAPRGAP
jgi:hypothetical protein